MQPDRFSYGSNLEQASRFRQWRSALWPPGRDHRLHCLDLTADMPALGASFTAEVDSLRSLVDAEWTRCKAVGIAQRTRLHDAVAVAGALRRIARCLPAADDRRALELRAHAVEGGYEQHHLSALAGIEEEVAFVAGNLSTWYGKQAGGLPTAFGCVRDASAQGAVLAAGERLDEVAAHVRGLHSGLRLGDVPAFAATRLFFMAGEGNRHPKHIAYFLPEDEGVKYSPFKKTYYFVNTHRAILEAISLPLARRFLDLGMPAPVDAAALEPIPTLGVLAHEMGHFVQREGTSFAGLNARDRWASLMLQETSADVFGFLIVAEVLAPALGLQVADVVLYHLAECLRYVNRGLGLFPDSDGMYLQLNYLAAFGALRVTAGKEVRLACDPAVVVAAFRSLARVLADTLLDGQVERTLALYRDFGPATLDQLTPLVAMLRVGPQQSIEYLQEPCSPDARAS